MKLIRVHFVDGDTVIFSKVHFQEDDDNYFFVGRSDGKSAKIIVPKANVKYLQVEDW